MKKMTRLLTLFLVVLLSLSLVGCGKKEEPVEDVEPESEGWELEEEYDDSEDSWELDWEDTDSEDEEDDDWGFSLE